MESIPKNFYKFNKLRIELLGKKYTEGLSGKEEKQLKFYTERCRELYPKPDFGPLLEIEKTLKALKEA